MKSDWQYKRLGELVTFTSGGTPSKSKPHFWNGNIPWISAKTMREERVSSSDLFITEEGLQAGSKLAPKGSILLLTRGSGLFNGIPICLVEEEVAFNQDVKCLKSCSEVENKFIFYWLISQKKYLSAKVGVTGIGAGKFDTDFLTNLIVPIPPKEEREQIVALAEALSQRIETNKKINENLEKQAQALFKRWFVDFEFPNEEGKPYRSSGGKMVESEMGLIPEGWIVQSAKEFYDISIGKTPPRKESEWFSQNYNDVKWVSISDMGNSGTYILDTSEFLTRDAVDKFNVKLVPRNTVLLSFKLTIGRVVITNEIMATNEAIAHFKTNDESLVEYTYFSLKNYRYDELGSTSSIATAINSKIIKDMPFLMPEPKIIARFHDVTRVIMNQIRENQNSSNTLSEIRDTLLPKLMSGEISLDSQVINTEKVVG